MCVFNVKIDIEFILVIQEEGNSLIAMLAKDLP